MCSLFFRQISQQERGACVIPFCFWYFWQTFVSSYLQFSSLSTVETNSLKDLIKFIQRRIKLSLKSAGPSEFEGGHDFKPYSATRFKRIYLWGIGLHSFIYSEQKKGLKIKGRRGGWRRKFNPLIETWVMGPVVRTSTNLWHALGFVDC